MKKHVLIAFAAMAFATASAFASDPVAGREKSKPCAACPGSEQSLAFLIDQPNPYAIIRNFRTSGSDTQAGSELFLARCASCHGPDGNSPSPQFPKIAGQHYDYLVKVLNDYKSGARKNAIMAPQAANLSKRDISDLAAFYSMQRGLYVKY